MSASTMARYSTGRRTKQADRGGAGRKSKTIGPGPARHPKIRRREFRGIFANDTRARKRRGGGLILCRNETPGTGMCGTERKCARNCDLKSKGRARAQGATIMTTSLPPPQIGSFSEPAIRKRRGSGGGDVGATPDRPDNSACQSPDDHVAWRIGAPRT